MIEYIPNENELELSVSECDNDMIKALAKVLEDVGLSAYAKNYYKRKNGGEPYFVITKSYAKENENEPNTMNMWIDVSHEYTVSAQYYYHTHFDNAEAAAKAVKDFYDEKLAEYLIITPDYTIAFAHEAKQNWEEAMQVMAENEPLVASVFKEMAPTIPENSHHCHSYRYGKGLPLDDIIIAKESNQPLCERSFYRISVIFGRQAEYYFDSN